MPASHRIVVVRFARPRRECIYRLNGHKLEICLSAADGDELPTVFSSLKETKGASAGYTVYECVKD